MTSSAGRMPMFDSVLKKASLFWGCNVWENAQNSFRKFTCKRRGSVTLWNKVEAEKSDTFYIAVLGNLSRWRFPIPVRVFYHRPWPRLLAVQKDLSGTSRRPGIKSEEEIKDVSVTLKINKQGYGNTTLDPPADLDPTVVSNLLNLWWLSEKRK